MRKLVYGFIAAHVALLFFLFLRFSILDIPSQTLHRDTVRIFFAQQPGKPHSHAAVRYFFELAQQHHVCFSKYIYKNKNELIIYTTDPSLQQNIRLLNGRYPRPFTSEVIVSRAGGNEADRVGTLFWNNPDMIVKVKSLSNVQEVPLDGVFYIHHSKGDDISTIVSQLNKNLGISERLPALGPASISLNHFIYVELILAVSVLISWLAIIFVYTHEVLDRTKRHALERLHGYPIARLAGQTFLRPAVMILLCMSVGFLLLNMFCYVANGGTCYGTYVVMLAGWTMMCIGLLYVYTLALVYVQVHWFSANQAIKGFKPLRASIVLNGVAKSAFIIVFLCSSGEWVERNNELKTERQSLQCWEQTRNVYQTALRFITRDIEKYRPYQLKIKDFYRALEKKGGFLINASNYKTIFAEGKRIYELNAPGEESLYSPSGRCITINTNYLKRHPIYQNGRAIGEQDIVRADKTMNVLVPYRLQKYEPQIRQHFLKHFYFHKIVVPTFYGKKREPITQQQAGLSLHLIYVDDDQSYFTYNINTVPEANYTVTNPTAIVDTCNLDASSYSSRVSRCVFFESPAHQEGYAFVLPLAKQTDTLASIQNVYPVYTMKGETIVRLQEQQQYFGTILIVVWFALLAICYSYVAKYVEKQKQRLYIQKIFGYGFFHRMPFFFIGAVGVDVLLVLLLIWLLGKAQLVPWALGLIGFEVGLFLLLYFYFDQKTMVTFVKGART